MNLSAIGERIKIIRKEIANESQERFAEQMCMTQSNLSLIESQKGLPSCILLYRLRDTYHINLNWLLTGKGDIQL